MKKLFTIGMLTLFGLSLLSAGTPTRPKTCVISIVAPTKVGNAQLKPGDYKVKVEGSNAVFTELESSKSVTTPVKVEDGNEKFDETRVQITRTSGAAVLEEIDLGGSKTKLEF